MRILSLSMVYPNPVQPTHGVFVRERLLRLAAAHEVTVVAPVPYFPLATGRMENRPAGVPACRDDGPMQVWHPRFWSPPAIGKALDGFLYAASVYRLVARLHRRHRFALLDAHFAYPDGFAAVLLGRRLGIPVTVTLRGTLADLGRRPSRRWAIARALRGADAVLAVSDALAADAAGAGLDPGQVAVVPNGVDTELFRPTDRAAARAALALPHERPLVVSVGALREVKGHHHLLRALALLRQRVPGAMAAIVGGPGVSDDRSQQLRRLAERLGVGDAVVWAGSRPHAEIPLWLGAADAFALASRREGCCNALLEALACGRPVVATAVGGNPEIVTGPELGRLVPAANPEALAEALAQVLARAWDPAAIRAAVRDRGWDRTAAAVDAVWREVAGTARRGRSESRRPRQERSARALEAVAVSGLVPPLLRAARQVRGGSSFVVLTYHRFGGTGDPFFQGITRADFARQMRYLKAAWNVLPVRELLARAEQASLPPLAAAITFDDNYLSVHREALPVLRELGLPAMIFVPTGPLSSGGLLWYDRVLHAFKHGRPARLPALGVPGLEVLRADRPGPRAAAAHDVLAWMRTLSEADRARALAEIEGTLGPIDPEREHAHRLGTLSDLRAALAAGVEVGSHTVSHPILSRLPDERIRAELAESRATLEDALQVPVDVFAYPNGGAADYDERAIAALRATGYRYAFCTTPGINRSDWRSYRYRLRRLDATETEPRRLMLRLAALELAA